MIGWSFFKTSSINEALYILNPKILFNGLLLSPITYFTSGISIICSSREELLLIIVTIFMLLIYDLLSLKKDIIKWISNKNPAIRWTIYLIFILSILFFYKYNVETEFLYFEF